MKICVKSGNRQRELPVKEGDNLLAVLRSAGYRLQTPCGGRGTCGKCRVSLNGIGSVLSCQQVLEPALWQQAGLKPDQPLPVSLPLALGAQISTEGFLPEFKLHPRIRRGTVRLPAPSLSDQRSFDLRFTEMTGIRVPLEQLRDLPADWLTEPVTVTYLYRTDTQCLVCWLGQETGEPLGVAVDIGTTTIGAWLYGLESGLRLAAAAMLNPQQSYGADVISRIEQAGQSESIRQELRDQVARAIHDLCSRLLEQSRPVRSAGTLPPPDLSTIYQLVIAGNTTMLHLLAGLPPASLARTPFIPVSLDQQWLTPAELGLDLQKTTLIELLPGISSYVGADITAGILACSLAQPPAEPGRARKAEGARQPWPIKILLDIGTNGEIVLSGPAGLTACSTAAGPAFEGANITCGLGGVRGAIDRVDWQDDRLVCRLIELDAAADEEQEPLRPLGICGSGLLAAVAVCLDLGLIDETGRIADDPQDLEPAARPYLGSIAGQPAIILVPADPDQNQPAIYLNQKDIREVQNAKAALAAGIILLIEQAGLQPADVEALYLAGGFGQYLDPEHAFRIGLLPVELRGRTTAVGNTSGMGASLCLLDQEQSSQAQALTGQVRYYELSADKRFTELYVDAMFFPETES